MSTKRRRAQFRVWFAVWAGDESTVFRMVKTKGAARALVADLRSSTWAQGVTFGWKRLIELLRPRTRRAGRRRGTK